MELTLKYPQYLQSAKRHNYVCRLLRDKIETLDEQDLNSDNFRHLLCSLYYLSGYIIECSLKFKIFECSGYDSEAEIDANVCQNYGINYNKKIKTHSFTTLQNFLDTKISDITYESSETRTARLLAGWAPEVRYEAQELGSDEVIDFYAHASDFLRRM